jgi:hypothetical protein
MKTDSEYLDELLSFVDHADNGFLSTTAMDKIHEKVKEIRAERSQPKDCHKCQHLKPARRKTGWNDLVFHVECEIGECRFEPKETSL